jgi:hypothetical protein
LELVVNPLPWSHSALQDFLTCGKQYYEVRIAKSVAKGTNEYGDWGDYVHKQFDAYMKAGGAYTLPENIAHYEPYIAQFLHLKGEVFSERQYAINRLMQPCGFKDKGVWCRGVIDILQINKRKALAVDHKTGKRKEDSPQLRLCALLVFIHHPEVEQCDVHFNWLKVDQRDIETFYRRDEKELWATFKDDLTKYVFAFKNEMFLPRPSGLCNGWCPVTHCEYWKPKR